MAACTLVVSNGIAPRTSVKASNTDAVRFAIVKVTPSSSYDTGGSTCDFGAFGGVLGGSASKEPTYVFIQPSAGYVPEWIATTKKLKIWWQSAATSALTEVSSTTDVSAVTFNCLLFY